MIYKKLRELFSNIDNPTIIEIGAHIGTDTKKLVKLLKSPYTYLAIEPDIRDHKQLTQVCQGSKVQMLPAAAGVKNDVIPFYYSTGRRNKGAREHTDSSSTKEPIITAKRPAWIEFDRGYVICMKLDWISTLYQLDHIDLIWMDVQGAELEVFEGGQNTLSKTDYIYTECQEGRYKGQPGLRGILGALPGWEVVLRNGENVLLRNGGTQE